MARQPVEPTSEQFFALLNSRDDLTAVIYGLASIEARLDTALAGMLVKGGLTPDVTARHAIKDKAYHLVDAGVLDPEFLPLLGHLVQVRNRFAHQLQTAITVEEGNRAWDLLPGKDRTARSKTRENGSPGHHVRWAIVVLYVRLQNRAIYGHGANVPWW